MTKAIPQSVLDKHLGILGINGRTLLGRAEAIIEPSDNEKAYAAGLFDGEGNITIAANHGVKGARGTIYNMRVGVSQNDADPLFWLRDRWGGSVNPMRRITARHNITHFWGCFARKAHKFLLDVRPFLQVKASRADIAILFQSTRFNPGVTGHTEEYREQARRLRDQLADLNAHKSSETINRLAMTRGP